MSIYIYKFINMYIIHIKYIYIYFLETFYLFLILLRSTFWISLTTYVLQDEDRSREGKLEINVIIHGTVFYYIV